MTAFTKGPWNIHHAYPLDKEPRTTKSKPGDNIGPITFWDGTIAQGDKILAVAQMQVSHNGGWPHVTDVEEARANTYLMVASPRLHAAVVEAIQLLGSYDFLDDKANAVLVQLREALAAAEGRVIA